LYRTPAFIAPALKPGTDILLSGLMDCCLF